jgi:hypothetical protein
VRRDWRDRYDARTARIELPQRRKEIGCSLYEITGWAEIDDHARWVLLDLPEGEDGFVRLPCHSVETKRCPRRVMALELPR